MKLFEAAVIVFLFNVPFGYWRANVKKFSMQWALAIHVPVPFVIGLRFLLGLGFAFITYPVLVGAFFTGQLLGSKLHNHWKDSLDFPVTSCMACDIIRQRVYNPPDKNLF